MSPQCRNRGIAVAAAAILLVPAFAQTKAPTPPSGSVPTTGTIPSNPVSTTPGNTNSPTSNTQNLPQTPIRVNGRVLLDDGTAPPVSVVVERVCGGNTHAEGYTDASGYFSLALGQTTEVIGDASQDSMSGPQPGSQPAARGNSNTVLGGSRNFGPENRYANCDLRARLGGYTSQLVSLANRSPLDDPNIGTILLHHLGESEKGTTVTATSLAAPKDARRANQRGLDLLKKKKTEEAIASFAEAVRLYPRFASAWVELGRLQGQSGHTLEARESFEAAVRAEPRWPEPIMRLALMDADAHRWKDVADKSDRVLRINSFEYPEAFFLNAAANYNLRHMDVAEKSALSAEKLDTNHQYPEIARLLGTILTERHLYAQAAEKFRTYLTFAPDADDAAATRKQLAEAEKLAAQSEAQAARVNQQ